MTEENTGRDVEQMSTDEVARELYARAFHSNGLQFVSSRLMLSLMASMDAEVKARDAQLARDNFGREER